MTDTSVNPPELEDAPEPVLSERQQEWLETLSGLKLASDLARERSDNHKEGLELIQSELDLDALKEGMSFEVEKVPSGAWENFKDKIGMLDTLKSVNPGGDPMKEIDSWHDLPGTKGMKPEEIQAVMMTFKEIIKVQGKLENMPAYQKLDENGETVVDDLKIREDLWMPLVREGVIPENVVPDRFSEVASTFSGASEAYDARLQEYSKDLTGPKKIMEILDVGVSVTSSLLKVGSAAATGVAGGIAAAQGVDSIQKSSEAREAIKVKNVLDLTLICVTSTHTIAKEVADAKDVHNIVDAFNAMLTGILKATVGSDTANLVNTIITCSSRGTRAAKHLAKGDVAAALDDIADAVAAGITQNNKDDKYMAQHIRGGIKALAAVAKGVQTKDPREAVAAAIGAAAVHANAVGSQIKSDAKDAATEKVKADSSLTEEERKAQLAYISTNTSTNPSGLDSVEKGLSTGITMKSLDEMVSAGFDKDAAEAQKKAYDEEQQQAMADFRNEPDPVFEELLVNGFTDTDADISGDEEKELRSLERQAAQIEKLIAICKKDQMTYDLTKQIVTGGAGFVASLLPAAGIVAVGTQLIFSIIEAVKHSEQLAIWAENMAGAKAAKSVQADAIMNRYGLQTTQTIKADIVVALKAVDLVGQIVKTAGGPAAPAGIAVSAAAQGAEGIMEIALTIKTEVEMANAWKVYKKALKTPQDRKLARQALQKNPTLSKYAMAYGACRERNPIAMNALKSCGLNARTMADPGTNISKVVTYLETVYREDPVLLRAVVVTEKWHPGKPELTVMSWGSFYIAATTSKDIEVKVKAADVSKISAAMAVFEKDHSAKEAYFDDGWMPDEDDTDPEIVESTRKAAEALVAALGSYNPVGVDDQPHENMADVVDAFEQQAKDVVEACGDIKKEIAGALADAEELAKIMGLAPEDDDEFI
ncbi:hypothetical protein DL239_02235 [Sedimentitalea sp. CY04]|uniref:Uncharacterized protein n=1 Tax=Parasedimentitalea denitrificans TaxID=2211118 RepID=A0ABX0W2L9_9RHOB|nr:hypothetical protein [Sedimentitalea sp. CY04]NIZ59789.1 hypothetical protein [Sedimentitalea sp. CY04]